MAAVLGGLLGWIGAFAGLGAWGLALGAAATMAIVAVLARSSMARHPLGFMAGHGFAFVLLTWPVLWLVVGYARYVITGQALGN
jgi:hypothetical protein